MNVLLVNQYYPPDTSATAVILRDLALALGRLCSPIVLSGRPSYNPEFRHGFYFSKTEFMDHVRVDRVGSTSYDRGFLLGRVLNYVTYLILTLSLIHI